MTLLIMIMTIINHTDGSMISVSLSERLTMGWTYEDRYYKHQIDQGAKTPESFVFIG